MDGYSGALATSISVSQAPNGFVIGSYAGTNAAPDGGLIVSGLVGIGTTSPGYSLDVVNGNGVINSSLVYASATLVDNQLINLSEGSNQGGFGGGCVCAVGRQGVRL